MRPLLALLLVAPTLLAAPVPVADDKPKPRAKLVGTLTLDVQVQSAFWTPDGKHLVTATDKRILVYPRTAFNGTEKPKPLTAFDRPGDGYSGLGLTPDGGLWVLDPAGRKVNAENRVLVWEAKTLLAGGEPKPDRTIVLEADNPNGLQWSADGKSLFTHVMSTRNVGNPNAGWGGGRDVEYLPKFFRLSAATGDVAHSVAGSDLNANEYAGSAFDPRTGRLFLATVSGEETTVECREADGGKQVWERKLPAKAAPRSVGTMRLTPDGEQLAFVQPTLTADPQGPGGPGGGFAPGAGGRGGGRPGGVSFSSASALVLLNTRTGEPGAEVSKATLRGAQVHSFSGDGRLLFAGLSGVEGSRLVVWDGKSGTEVKVWNRGYADVSAAFAPTGYDLLIVERERKEVLGPSQNVPSGQGRDGSQMWTARQEVVRTEYTSTLGLWDLSPVVK